MNVPRWLSPSTNPVLGPALASLAYSAWQAIQAAQASGPLTWQRCVNIAAGVGLAGALKYVVRARVTPLADPRDGNGNPLRTNTVSLGPYAHALAAGKLVMIPPEAELVPVPGKPGQNLATGVVNPPVPGGTP